MITGGIGADVSSGWC